MPINNNLSSIVPAYTGARPTEQKKEKQPATNSTDSEFKKLLQERQEQSYASIQSPLE